MPSVSHIPRVVGPEAPVPDRQVGVGREIPTRVTRRPAVGTARLLATAVFIAIIVAGSYAIDDPEQSRSAALIGACLVLWITEAVPLFVTTVVLWVCAVLALGPLDPQAYAPERVLSSLSQPVLVLFFGGFVLSAAGAKYGIDGWISAAMVRTSRGNRRVMLALVMGVTAVLSMWMLNTAAAATMLATLRPVLGPEERSEASPADRAFAAAMLLGLAFGANFGGIATPIGTGPNLIAIGEAGEFGRITFLGWMAFGVPTTVVMATLAYAILVGAYRVNGTLDIKMRPARRSISSSGWAVVAIFGATVIGWMTEPWHGVQSAVVALACAALLFGTRLLEAADLRKIGWDTLVLIAGGLTVGQLLEQSGLARSFVGAMRLGAMPETVVLLLLVVACATLSAVASNTAAAAMLIPIATGLAPSASSAIIVALSASMGAPLVISTPPNALVYGEGVLRPRDFLLVGLPLMIAGCGFVALVGPVALRWLGHG
jgi:sodium-dependent dicarboxylate transporter 2/3/5